MKIAFPVKYAKIAPVFEEAQGFKLVCIEDGHVQYTLDLETEENQGSPVGFLKGMGTEAVLCSQISEHDAIALQNAGIKLYKDVEGTVNLGLSMFLNGLLEETVSENLGPNCQDCCSAENCQSCPSCSR